MGKEIIPSVSLQYLMPPKTVSVIGYKDSGKTRVVQAIVKELTSRGYKVGTIKHTADDISLDTPGKDTERHRLAGSKVSALLQQEEAAIFFDQHLTLQQASEKLGPVDYLIVEGFKTLDTHSRIIVPKENSDVDKLKNGLEIAIVYIPGSNFNSISEIPSFNFDQFKELVDLIEKKAFPLLPGLNCHSCGYDNCKEMGKSMLAGEAKIEQCVGFGGRFSLTVNDVNVPLNNFTMKAMQNVILGFIKTLKGGEEAKKVALEFETE